jgi:hypothetical protein
MSKFTRNFIVRFRLPGAALMIAAVFALGPQALAADPVNMQVVRYDRLPVRPKLSVEATENTELASYAKIGLTNALEQHGIAHGDSGQLVATIAVQKIDGNQSPAMSFDAETGRLRVGIDNAEPPLYAQIGQQYRISLDLYDRQSGHYLWRGQITDEGPDTDPYVATKPMIEKLVSALLSRGPSEKCRINQICYSGSSLEK